MESNVGKLQYWVVAFLDLLGQGRLMSGIDFIPDKSDTEEFKKIKDKYYKVYGAIKLFRSSFDDFITRYYSNKKDINTLDEDDLCYYKKTQPEILRIQRFSDGIVIYMPLSNIDNKSPCAGLFCMLAACATSLLRCLAQDMPFRGGIDVATGMEMEDNDLYGPVLYKAYTLENKYAQYSRIVVGDGLINYLLEARDQKENTKKTEFEKNVAGICLDLLMKDFDGLAAVDYLGEGFCQHVARGVNYEIIEKAQACAIGQYELAKDKKDTKLSFRYAILVNYSTFGDATALCVTHNIPKILHI